MAEKGIPAKTLWAIKLIVHLILLGVLSYLTLGCIGLLEIPFVTNEVCPLLLIAEAVALISVILDGAPGTGNHFP